jgi:hypothetical protein
MYDQMRNTTLQCTGRNTDDRGQKTLLFPHIYPGGKNLKEKTLSQMSSPIASDAIGGDRRLIPRFFDKTGSKSLKKSQTM